MGEKLRKQGIKEVTVPTHTKKYQLVEKVCPVCGEKFTGNLQMKYDKPACRQKANYAKHGAEYRRQQRQKYAAQKATKKR